MPMPYSYPMKHPVGVSHVTSPLVFLYILQHDVGICSYGMIMNANTSLCASSGINLIRVMVSILLNSHEIVDIVRCNSG